MSESPIWRQSVQTASVFPPWASLYDKSSPPPMEKGETLNFFSIQSCNKRTDVFFQHFYVAHPWVGFCGSPLFCGSSLSLEFFRSQNCQQQAPPQSDFQIHQSLHRRRGVFFISFFSTGSHRFLENLVYHFFRQRLGWF